jgi:hypothetical protein
MCVFTTVFKDVILLIMCVIIYIYVCIYYYIVLSIDPPGCKDIDDALHSRPLPNGNLEVSKSL